MIKIWKITVQAFALLTMAAFLEMSELGIERDETYDPGLYEEQTEGRGILLEIPAQIRSFLSVESFTGCFIRPIRISSVRCMLTCILRSRFVSIRWRYRAWASENVSLL